MAHHADLRGLTRPESYQLRLDWKVVGSGSSQRECKDEAETTRMDSPTHITTRLEDQHGTGWLVTLVDRTPRRGALSIYSSSAQESSRLHIYPECFSE